MGSYNLINLSLTGGKRSTPGPFRIWSSFPLPSLPRGTNSFGMASSSTHWKGTIECSTKPDNRRALVARSETNSRLGRFEEALADVERVLKRHKKHHEALYQKAETLFQLGRYEHALVFYHRGRKVKPDSEKLKTGINKSQEAIYAALKMQPEKKEHKNAFKNDL